MAQVILMLTCVAFIVVNGRNDGAPLTAIALQSRGERDWAAIFYLWLLLPVVPLLGFWGVAESLHDMMGLADFAPAQATAMILAELVTIALSNLVDIPTSITLGLVGALVGSGWAGGTGTPAGVLARVLILGLCAPFVAATIAFILGKLPLSDTQGTRTFLLAYRYVALPLLIHLYKAHYFRHFLVPKIFDGLFY